jgi:hypothetical protein
LRSVGLGRQIRERISCSSDKVGNDDGDAYIVFVFELLPACSKKLFLNRFQVENLTVAKLIGINLPIYFKFGT